MKKLRYLFLLLMSSFLSASFPTKQELLEGASHAKQLTSPRTPLTQQFTSLCPTKKLSFMQESVNAYLDAFYEEPIYLITHSDDQSSPCIVFIDAQRVIAESFALLPSHAFIIVSQGLLDRMNDEELAAALAHEEGHIAQRHDQKKCAGHLMSWIATLATGFFLRKEGVMQCGVATLATAALGFGLYAWLSDRYEYDADAYAAQKVPPKDLIAALRKIAGNDSELFQGRIKTLKAFNA